MHLICLKISTILNHSKNILHLKKNWGNPAHAHHCDVNRQWDCQSFLTYETQTRPFFTSLLTSETFTQVCWWVKVLQKFVDEWSFYSNLLTNEAFTQVCCGWNWFTQGCAISSVFLWIKWYATVPGICILHGWVLCTFVCYNIHCFHLHYRCNDITHVYTFWCDNLKMYLLHGQEHCQNIGPYGFRFNQNEGCWIFFYFSTLHTFTPVKCQSVKIET
jgi:hypothetical protein